MDNVEAKLDDIKCLLGKLRESVEDGGDLGDCPQEDPKLREQERLVGLLCSVTECSEMLRRDIEVAVKVTQIDPKQVSDAITDWVAKLRDLAERGVVLVNEAMNLDRPSKLPPK